MKTIASASKLLKRLRSTLIGICAAAMLLGSPAVSADVLHWTFTGPGNTTVSATAATTTFDYYLLGESAREMQTWTATAVAANAGNYTFDWNYSGFNIFGGVYAFLSATDADGTSFLLILTPFDAFSAVGTYTFANVNAGDTLALEFGGLSYDFRPSLQGALTLTQTSAVPEPASLALLGLGLMGVLAARNKRRS